MGTAIMLGVRRAVSRKQPSTVPRHSLHAQIRRRILPGHVQRCFLATAHRAHRLARAPLALAGQVTAESTDDLSKVQNMLIDWLQRIFVGVREPLGDDYGLHDETLVYIHLLVGSCVPSFMAGGWNPIHVVQAGMQKDVSLQADSRDSLGSPPATPEEPTDAS